MIYGTAHFKSETAAFNYYAKQGYTYKDVRQMVLDGEIFLGPPSLKSDERYYLNSEFRYMIVSKEEAA